jgi:outer membrane lipoprotein-sorting protein
MEKEMMVPVSRGSNFHAGRFLPTLVLLSGCIAAVAQQAAVSAPLSADEVVRHVEQLNEQQANALETYTSVRTYHLECHCLSHKEADMVVRAEYKAPDKMRFVIVSESGSGTLRSHVFKKLLEAEQESLRKENQKSWAVTSKNYTFQLTDYRKIDRDEFYVLEVRPLTKNKFLFRGRIWVDAKDFGIAQVEGEPALNPSWWTVETDFKGSFQKISGFWLPVSNESKTKVRILGSAALTIKYGEYQITEAHNLKTAVDVGEKLSNEH